MTIRTFPTLLFTMMCTTPLCFAQTKAPTQAACTFSFYQSRSFAAAGINDFGTLVGAAAAGKSSAGAIRWANGAVTSVSGTTLLLGRNDAGISIGLDQGGRPIIFRGKSITRIGLVIGGTFYTMFAPTGVNKWGTIVGTYKDAAGVTHGFKRWGNGAGISLDYPGAKETDPVSINDDGIVVGFYSPVSPPSQPHGFIYHNGHWATLDFPNTPQYTALTGVTNSGIVFGNTFDPFFESATTAFLYRRGRFEVIPSSQHGYVVVDAISLIRGLILGEAVDPDGLRHPLIADCK